MSTTIFTEGFETDGNGTRYTTTTAEFTDGFGDFFLRTDGSDIGSFVSYADPEGTFFFAGMDLDGEGAASTQTITFGAIDITGYGNLTFSGLFAEDDDGSNEDWDNADSVVFEYKIDGGAWTSLLAFGIDASEVDGLNGFPSQDTDFDGVGDGTALTDTFSEFSANISGTGSSLELRVTMSLDSGDEDFAMDALTVMGDDGPFDLQVTEIWNGQIGTDLTEDWFEITNVGGGDWVSGVDSALFYDDESQDATTKDLIQGIDRINAGESAIVVLGESEAVVTEFINVWSPVIDLTGVEIGWADGSGLGGGGDAVTLFDDADTVLDYEAYPDAENFSGQSFDVDTAAFNEGGQSGVATTQALGGTNSDEPAVGNPGNGDLIEAVSDFTLELFHIGDQEGSSSTVINAPNLSAVLNALQSEDLGDDGEADNTLILSSGDAIIPGVFYSASEDVFGYEGVGDIQIQNELGIQAIALGNHEFDRGTGVLSDLITGETGFAPAQPIADFSALTTSDLAGQDFTGADFAYLSTNLDFSTDSAMAPLEVAGGQAPQANSVTSSVVIDVNGEDIGVVGATTPTLASISSPGGVGATPAWANGNNPTEEELAALAAEIQLEVDALLAANPDMNKVVLLAHMQNLDIETALAERLSGVDIIVAGGSNTRLTDSDDRLRDGDTSQGTYPIFRNDLDGNSVAVVNTDGSYKYLGRLVIDFDEDGNVIADSYDETVSGAYATDDEGVLEVAASLMSFEMSEDQQTGDVPDTAATGAIQIDAFDAATNTVTISGTFEGLQDANPGNALSPVGAVDSEGNPQSAIHLHTGEAGSNGGIVRNFTVTDNGDGSGSFTGTFTFTEDELANFLAGDTYVNLHTSDFGSGQLRGQVNIPAELADEGLVDAEIQAIADALEAQIIATEGNVLGFSDVFLTGNRSGTGAGDDTDGVRTQETNLGNLTADANLWAAQQIDSDVMFSLKNGGGIRANIGETVVPAGGSEAVRTVNAEIIDGDGNVVKPEGGISQTDIQTTLAFNNDLVVMTLTVSEIVGLLEHGVASSPVSDGQFAHIAGGSFSFDDDLPAGARVVDAALEANDGTLIPLVIDGDIQSPNDTYRIVTLGFLASPRFDDETGAFEGGGDGYPFPNFNTDPERGELGDPDVVARMNVVFLEEEGVQTGAATFADNGTEQDALAEYLQEFHGTEDTAFDQADTGPNSDSRIQNLDFVQSTIFPTVGPAFFNYTQNFDAEESGGRYTDTGDAAVDHDLVNNPGEQTVDSQFSGIDLNGTLAYDATYVNTRNDEGLTDGDFVGVATFTGTVGAFTSGDRGYQLQDTDGLMLTRFETVDISSAASDVVVSLDLFVQSTSWEDDDVIQIGVDTDGDGEIDVTLLNTTGQDVDDLGIEGEWITLSATLPSAAEEATLLVALDSNSSSETIYVDSISIATAPVEKFLFRQSFETDNAGNRNYRDNDPNPNSDHDLINNQSATRRLVDSVESSAAINGELSFDARFEDTRTGNLSGGAGVGVGDNTKVVDAYTDGDHGYQFRNTQGNVVLEFEEVDTSGVDLVTVSLDMHVADIGRYGKNDRIFVGVDTDGDGEADVTMIDSTGSRVTDVIPVRGDWFTLTTEIVQPESVSLIVEVDNNARFEVVTIDNITIEGDSNVAGIAADPAPEAAKSLETNVASVTTIAGGAEILAKLAGQNVVAIANGAGVSLVDMSDITAPVVIDTLDPAVLGGTDSSEATSVATFGTDVAFAVPAADGTSAGTLFFGNATAGYFTVSVSSLPDAVTFSEDGNYILVAIEAESAGGDNEPGVTPNPNGAVAIIGVERDGDGNLTGNFTANEFDFSDSSLTAEALRAKGVRINDEAPSVAADIEPEYITVKGNTAYVSLQENNAISIIEDITSFTGFTIDDIVSAGTTDHSEVGSGIDPSDKNDIADIATQNVIGLRMPDGLASFTVAGVTYFAGANEGDGREVDEARAKDANVDADAYSADDLQDENLGRLTVSTIDGDTDGDGDIDQLHSFGSRSFTIYDADGNEVFDSGDLLGRIVAAEQPDSRPENRDDNKGSEPEFVEFGEVDGVPYLFVGLERANAVVVFDITDPSAPVYDQFIDLPSVRGPEGLEFIPASDSPTGGALLAVTGEVDNALAIIELTPTAEPIAIGEVQGSGEEAALDGQSVLVRGVVVGEYNEDGELDGFYLQDVAADADGDASTSDGIFVYLGDAVNDSLPDVKEGDLITVAGTVDEFFGQTQIDLVTNIEVEASDQLDLVEAAILDLPGTGSYEVEGTYEAFEGMLITIPDEMFVSEYFELARFGQVVLTEGGRPFQFTQQNTPDVDGYNAHLEDLGMRQIILDDNNNIDNAYTGDDAVINLPDGGFSVDNFFRGGDSVTDLTGVLSWTWAGSGGTNAWRIRPTDDNPITFDSNEAREETPEDVGGSLKVVSFNVLNFFTTIDDGSDTGVNGSPNGGPRGANSEAELQAQLDKLVDAMIKMDGDVFGLVEIENEFGDLNGDGRYAVDTLVEALNAVAGAGTYDYVDPGVGTIGGDVITGAFIYDTTTVAITDGSNPAILDDTTNPLNFTNAVFDGVSTNRAAFATSFTEISSGESFVAAVNHFKSKGSINPADGNTDAGDGAGNNNAIRLQASQSLDAWLDTDPTGSGTDKIIILGDLNAYAKEDPITFLEGEGYTDLARAFEGDDAYSYLFDSQLGTLDYAMSNAALTPYVTGATEWHINADEVPLFDYNDDILDAGEQDFREEPGGTDLYNVDPFRTSDHDPVIVGLDLSITPTDSFDFV